jgi:hypothetical protein
VIRSKVRAYQLAYLSSLDDLGPVPDAGQPSS